MFVSAKNCWVTLKDGKDLMIDNFASKVNVESGFLSASQGLREHCVQGNVMLMSIIFIKSVFFLFLNSTCVQG